MDKFNFYSLTGSLHANTIYHRRHRYRLCTSLLNLHTHLPREILGGITYVLKRLVTRVFLYNTTIPFYTSARQIYGQRLLRKRDLYASPTALA